MNGIGHYSILRPYERRGYHQEGNCQEGSFHLKK
jgi:hypothetical protein